ncbi:MAG: metallophosphoesterase [Thermoguttaceae bacterium]|nr:metallophosphoesterase [Thermoguttaceae bacterium]
MDGRRLRFYSKAISEPVKILQISDSHLYLDDERGEEYREFSGRMAKAYNSTKNFQTGESTNPIEMFKAIADEAPSQKPDAIVLTGDIVSFPTAAGVDYVLEQLEKTGIPFYYVAGNHDWHFEGMLGSERELRDEWIEKRLKPLYPQGVDPLAYSVDVKGIKLLLVDDSIYEILPKQLDFVREELASGAPSAIFMHIPLYAPGRSVGFGVGHPKWNADSDGNYKIERRPQWPKEGHTETTYAFRNELLEAPNLLGAFTGHIHSHSLDICSGKPLSVAPAANDGSTLLVEFLPFKD